MQFVYVLSTTFALLGVACSVTFSSGTTATIDENVPAGTTLMTVAASTNGTPPVTFAVTAQTPESLYTANASKGVITVASGQTIDAETTASHTVTITGSDAAKKTDTETSVIMVTVIDKNDNAPVFNSKMTGNLMAFGKSGTVGVYIATDADISAPNNVIAFYRLNCTEEFVINGGTVTVREGSIGPEDGCYTIGITAVDSGTGALTGSATIFVSVGSASCQTDANWADMCGGSPSLTFSLMAMILGPLSYQMK